MIQNSRIRGNIQRPKAFWGMVIPAALNFVGSMITNSQQAKAQKRMMEEQQRLAQQQLNISNQNNLAATINNSVAAQDSYDNEDYYNLKYRNGGTRKLGSNGITITDGGNAKRIGNNTFLLQGGSHEDVNETGQTGIGINVGGNEIEAEGGEVAQKKGKSLRIFSAQPMLNDGISPAQAVVNGANKDKVFAAQQRFKKNNGIKDDGSKFDNGGINKIYNNYSTTYKNKTSRGNKLSINKGKVYLNGKLAHKGYRWFDRSNRVNYAVNADGTYRIEKIHGVNPLSRNNKSRILYDKIIDGYNSQFDNYINPLNDALTNEIKFLKNRMNKEDNYIIPNYLPNVPTIKLKTKVKGNKKSIFNGVEIPVNMVDSIYKWSKEANEPLYKGFGLTGETSGGKNKPFSNKLEREDYYKKLVNGKGYYYPTELTNAHHYFISPETDDINTMINQKLVISTDDLGKNDYLPKLVMYNGNEDIDNEVNNRLQYTKKTNGYSDHPFIHALQYLNKANYGMGKDYPNTVKERGNEFLTDKNVQKRINYIRRNNMYRCGGRIKAENGMKLSLDDSYAKHDLLYQLTKNHPTARKIVDEVFGSESDRRRFVEDLQRFGYGSEDASSIAGASPIFRQPIVSAAKQSQFIRNTNNVRKGVTSTAPFTAEHFVNKTKDLGNSLTSILHEIGNKLGTNINKTPITRTPSAIELNIYNGAKNMTNGANPFLYTPRNAMKISKPNIKVPKVNGKTLGKITGYSAAALAPTIGAYFVSKRNDNKNETVNNQLDAKGQPISPYIARPKNTISNKPVKKDSTSSIPDSIRRPQSKKDSVITDTIKQTKPVIQQKTSTPKYKSNVTKGNYRLHDGEFKVINGTRYSRVGNNIINHKTNVAYIYDKNGNYTGQADYSKVGKNFNDAFDAAKAAGRTNFIYRAGKYNKYSTAKENDVKKEALSRKVGAKRIAKRMGGLTNPPVERKKYVNGGNSNPWDKYKVPNYGGVAPWQISNMYDVTIPYAITEQDLPIVSVSAPKNVSNNPIIKNVGIETKKTTNNSIVPYLGRQSSFKPAAQDYIGLGIDTLAALGSGMFARRAYDNLNFDYKLPSYVDESPVAFDTTYHNESQRANVERNRINGRNLIQGNTASAQTSLSRMQQGDVNAMMELNKLADEKANKEVELRNQNAANEQQVRARNAAARNQYYQNVAQIQNAAIEARNNAALAKAQSIGADFSGLSQAWSNFAGSVENRYNANQNQIAIMAQAENPSVVQNAITMGYDLSPQVLANLYRSTNNEDLKKAILGRISYKDRNRYSLN